MPCDCVARACAGILLAPGALFGAEWQKNMRAMLCPRSGLDTFDPRNRIPGIAAVPALGLEIFQIYFYPHI